MKIKSKFHNPKLRTKLLGTLMAAFAMVVLVSCQNEEAIIDEQAAEVVDVPEEDAGSKIMYWKTWTGSGTYRLKNSKSGKYLSASGRSSGYNLKQLDKGKGWDKFFFYRYNTGDAAGHYSIRLHANTNLAVEVGGYKTGNGANILLWTNNNTANQHWEVKIDYDTNYIRMRNMSWKSGASEKVLSVHGASNKSEANVVQWELNDNGDQWWELEKVD